MKSTGITRKIDELGRVVIPKEIRRNLGIRDGESLEILLEEDSIILKKHSVMKELESLSLSLSEVISDVYKINVIITDREKVIASTVSKEMLNKRIDEFLINLIDNREVLIKKDKISSNIGGVNIDGFFTIVPIIASIDSLGLVILVSDDYKDLSNLAKLVANIMSHDVIV